MKKSYSALIASFIFSLALILGLGHASAQSALSPQQEYPDVIQDQVDIQVIPSSPSPYDHVIITIADYNTDLDRAQINWSVNGKMKQGGVGGKSFELVMGGKGQVSTVRFTIQPTNGPLIERTITLVPEDVDLAWEARSYTAPFYKGKALYSSEGDLLFVATSNFFTSGGAAINPDSLIYKWSQDGTVLGSQSGYGKKTLTYSGNILSRPVTMTVEVSNLKGDLKARKSITVTAKDTKAVVYENNPVYGILFNKAESGALTLTSKEGKFEAFPYYFTGLTRSDPDIQYSWQLNGDPLLVPKTQHSMVFRNDTDGSGTAESSVAISQLSKLLQNASAKLSITYGSDSLKTFFDGQ